MIRKWKWSSLTNSIALVRRTPTKRTPNLWKRALKNLHMHVKLLQTCSFEVVAVDVAVQVL